MCSERELLDAYRRMCAWVERERRRLERTRERPTQHYLRRSRLLMDVDLLTLRELLRELNALK